MRILQFVKPAPILTALLIGVLLVAGCGGKAQPAPTAKPVQPSQTAAAQPTQAAAAQPTQPVTARPTQAAQPTPASQPTLAPTAARSATPRVAAATRAPAAAAGAGKFADPKELNSYRMKTTMWPKDEDKTKASTIVVEWVKNPPAEHTTMGSTEIITIGDQTWVKMMGRWVQQDRSTPQPQSSDVSANIMRQIEDKVTYKEVGRETINGITCKHFTYSGEATIQITEGALKGEAWVRGQGDSWVADQPGLPAVIIRNRGESEMKMKAPAGSGVTGDINIAMNVEMELYDINTPITITPPTDVFVPPTSPAGAAPRPTQTRGAGQPATPRPIVTVTPRSTATVAVRRTATPVATPAGKVSAWEFDRPIDGSWYAEGGVDATVGVEARPGYLRITAPSGNDLFPGTNFDAPTIFQVVSGDFTVETALEFVPTEDYQGAGLFIWQDPDNFVRLERCFGGLGGIDSGICLLKIADGAPEVIASPVDISTTAERVELRLQRAGEQVTAWWREASAASAGPWRTAGKMEIALPGGPQPMMEQGLRTGMLLCVEQGAAEISADFDVFRIRSQ